MIKLMIRGQNTQVENPYGLEMVQGYIDNIEYLCTRRKVSICDFNLQL
jgi:hypothetical protein